MTSPENKNGSFKYEINKGFSIKLEHNKHPLKNRFLLYIKYILNPTSR